MGAGRTRRPAARTLDLADGDIFDGRGRPAGRAAHARATRRARCASTRRTLGAVFTGDTLFEGGPGATGRSYCDFATIIDSIRDRLLTLPPDTVVHTGHGDDTASARRRRTSPSGSPAATEHLFHVALLADWEAAQQAGNYRVSTLGRTLEDEGFLHASFAHQWQGVHDAYYARRVDEPLVLLEVDPDLLDVPVVVETPEGADQAFPHLYGPLPVAAVVDVRPVTAV